MAGFEEKVIGLMLGGAVGDSLGLPWEGESSRSIQRECPKGPWDHFDGRELTDVKESAKVAGIDLGPSRIGEFTDDTECLMALADSLCKMKGLHPEHAAVNTCLWWQRGNTGGYSAWVHEKFASICRQKHKYNQTAAMHDKPSYGNGAVMRIGPLAVAYRPLRKDISTLTNVVSECLISTHTHPEAIDAALLMCVGLMHCLATCAAEFDQTAFLQELLDASNCDEMKARLQPMATYLAADGLKTTEDIFDPSDKEFLQSICTEGKWFQIRAVDALAYVLFVLCKYHATPEEAMVRMIALGGDCDTLACMLGQFLGALHGKVWIPHRWTNVMKCDPTAMAKKLADLECTQLGSTLPQTEIDGALAQLWKEVLATPIPVRHQL